MTAALGIVFGVGLFCLLWGVLDRSKWPLLVGCSLLAGFVGGLLDWITAR